MSDEFEDIKTEGWVSLRQFLKIAGITYPTALKWCKLGMIRYKQVGHMKRIYASEIKRFLEQGTLPADPILKAQEKAYRDKFKPGNEHLRALPKEQQAQYPSAANLAKLSNNGDPRDG